MFEMSETVGKLAEALAKAQGNIETIAKNKTADMDKYDYNYADLAAVLEGCRPQLSAEGIAIIQAPYISEDGSIGVTTALVHSSGEWMRSGISHSMKLGKWQDLGGALTYLRRYSLSAMVSVASEDDTDGAELKSKPKARSKSEPEPGPEPTWADKSQKIADAVKASATAEAVKKTLQIFTGDLQWLHDHKPHYYERLMEVATERENELRNVTKLEANQ